MSRLNEVVEKTVKPDDAAERALRRSLEALLRSEKVLSRTIPNRR
jgi:hypothetical protein